MSVVRTCMQETQTTEATKPKTNLFLPRGDSIWYNTFVMHNGYGQGSAENRAKIKHELPALWIVMHHHQ